MCVYNQLLYKVVIFLIDHQLLTLLITVCFGMEKRQLDEFRDMGQKVQDKNNDMIDALNKRKDEVFEGDWMDKIDDELRKGISDTMYSNI